MSALFGFLLWLKLKLVINASIHCQFNFGYWDSMDCCTMCIRLWSLAVPWVTLIDFLESFLKDKLKKPSKRINGHLHRMQHDILICSQESWQFGLARQILFFMEYAPVFCATNLLSLDELQVNGEGGSNTEMLGFSDMCSDNDDSEVMIENNSDHSVGEYLARCSKSGKSDHIFQVPKQSKVNFLLDLIRISSGWY